VSPDQISEGKALYEKIACSGCHGGKGRRDGPNAQSLTDDWGESIRPANFSKGILKLERNPGKNTGQLHRIRRDPDTFFYRPSLSQRKFWNWIILSVHLKNKGSKKGIVKENFSITEFLLEAKRLLMPLITK
jgi:hypothetical protein